MNAAKTARAEISATRSERWLLAVALLAIVIALLAGGGSAWRLWTENDALRAANSAAMSQAETLNEKLNELQERLTSSQQSKSAEQAAHEQTTARLKIKETELAYLKKNLASVRSELTNLADNLESTLRSRADLAEQVEKWSLALSERDATLTSLEKELANTYAQLDADQASRSALEQRLSESLHSNQKLLAERDTLQNRLADLLTRYAATLDSLENKFEEATARLNDNHIALNRIKHAWQIECQSHQTLFEQQQSLQQRLAQTERALAQTTKHLQLQLATKTALGACPEAASGTIIDSSSTPEQRTEETQ